MYRQVHNVKMSTRERKKYIKLNARSACIILYLNMYDAVPQIYTVKYLLSIQVVHVTPHRKVVHNVYG